jgi:predicted nucleotidyltransferase
MKWPKFEQFDLKKHTHLLAQVGSHSHGTYIAPKAGGIDDIDIMGLVVPPKNYYLGLDNFQHLCTWVDEYDITFYEAKKFMNLLLKNNPNVIGLLWLDETMYKIRTPLGQKLIDNREIFSSKQTYKSFTGYAYSQFRKMEHMAFEGYMGEKRKKLVEQFGYDTKNAAHLIRLLRMGMEFLSTGELNVMRHDSGQLIDIKLGKYKLETVKEMAEDLFKKTETAFLASKLPAQPDHKKANELLIELVEEGMK